jgi:hypothetical protein
VIQGRKTQTRRLYRGGYYEALSDINGKACVFSFTHHYYGHDETGPTMYDCEERIKWLVGRTYAVQPGRGQPTILYHPAHPCYGIDIIEPGSASYQGANDGSWPWREQGYVQARIRIKSIRLERLQEMTEEDAIAEGCVPYETGVVSPTGVKEVWPAISQAPDFWDSIHTKPGTRWADNPLVWVLEFEVVKK